jgi:septation ring formation regulator EzrA
MSSQFSADTLNQAREALVAAFQQNQNLYAQIQEQGQKIQDLYAQLDREAAARVHVEQQLDAARLEIDQLRAQLPSDAAIAAYAALEETLAQPQSQPGSLRLAA